MEVKSESEVAQSCPTLNNLMDCSLPGSSVLGIFQTRVLEWGAIAFSAEWLESGIKTIFRWYKYSILIRVWVFYMCVYTYTHTHICENS